MVRCGPTFLTRYVLCSFLGQCLYSHLSHPLFDNNKTFMISFSEICIFVYEIKHEMNKENNTVDIAYKHGIIFNYIKFGRTDILSLKLCTKKCH